MLCVPKNVSNECKTVKYTILKTLHYFPEKYIKNILKF